MAAQNNLASNLVFTVICVKGHRVDIYSQALCLVKLVTDVVVNIHFLLVVVMNDHLNFSELHLEFCLFYDFMFFSDGRMMIAI